jgi:hypothetical protein
MHRDNLPEINNRPGAENRDAFTEFDWPETFQYGSVKGRFAVVLTWPEMKNAEYEVVQRISLTAQSLGLECIVTDNSGYPIDSDSPLYGQQISSDNVDFCISLHFESARVYDCFTYGALWNPTDFYLEWGYQKTIDKILTCDDFLLCDAPAIERHIRRLTMTSRRHIAPELSMFHSLSEPIMKPKLGEMKIFYCGINWERLSKPKGRHHEFLARLDTTGMLKIYGPDIFLGVNVWEGYKSGSYRVSG